MSAAYEWGRVDDVKQSPARSGRARLELPVLVEADGATYTGITRNISQEGGFVAVRRPPSVGERLTLRLAVPGHEVPLAIKAEVRWLRPIDDAGGQPAGIGVSFIDPPFGVSLCLAWLLHSQEAR
jgi:Tfp pilus assembly protein PilZ